MIPWGDNVDSISLDSCLKNIRKGNSYVYLRESNMKYNLMSGAGGEYWYTSEVLPILEVERNKIYTNGGAVVYE